MPRKLMRNLCFLPKCSSSSSSPPFHFPSPSRLGFSPSQPSFSESVTGRTLDMAEPVIMKWNPETARVTSLFYQNRREAMHFIHTVNNLQKAMHFLLQDNSSMDKLARAQNLMQIAMKRLEKEFYQILSLNRAHLDPESVSTRSSHTSTGSSTPEYDDHYDDDDVTVVNEAISEVKDASTLAMEDLRLIAECMVSSGYAKECLKIYKVIRKSIVDEGIYRLGVEKFSSSKIYKMDWQVVEMRIQNWLNAVRTAVKILFNGERILCDHVFAISDSIRESCFTEITKEGAIVLFGFPENVVKNSKKLPPEKIFRVLDMYIGISEHWPEIDTIFSFQTTIHIKSQALTSLIKLGEFARAAMKDFESAVLKNSMKSQIPGGGGIHHLTIDAMNYLSILADYSNILSDILADSPPSEKHELPQSYFGFSESDGSPAPAISLRMAWIILALLCKIDAKAKYYKDVSLAYLFLANNLQYVVVKVRTSNLRYILGDEWLEKHGFMVKQFASNYERLGWSHVINCIPSDRTTAETPENAKEIFKKFNASFNQAYEKQCVCVVPDSELRDDIKSSIARKIVPLYRDFYNAHRPKMEREGTAANLNRFTPENLGHHLSDLFFAGNVESGGSSSFQSSPRHSPSSGSGWDFSFQKHVSCFIPTLESSPSVFETS